MAKTTQQASVEEHWSELKEAITEAALKAVGRKKSNFTKGMGQSRSQTTL